MLESLGLKISTATNGEEALRCLDREAFDIVLLDLQMPVMDGLTTIRHIRNDPRFEALPVIALTAHAMSGDRERSLAAGMDDHITKPINYEQLQSTLIRWVSGEPHTPDPQSHELPESSADLAQLELPGLNLKTSLPRFNGDLNRYLSLWQQFDQRYPDLQAQISGLLKSAEFSQLKPLAHSLRGVFANLGAEQLQQTCQQLEQLTQLPEDQGYALLTALSQQLEQLQQNLRRLQQPQPGAQSASHQTGHEQADINRQLDTLRGLLESADTDALTLLETLCQNSEGEGFSSLQPVLNAVQDFDFDLALEALDALQATDPCAPP